MRSNFSGCARQYIFLYLPTCIFEKSGHERYIENRHVFRPRLLGERTVEEDHEIEILATACNSCLGSGVWWREHAPSLAKLDGAAAPPARPWLLVGPPT